MNLPVSIADTILVLCGVPGFEPGGGYVGGLLPSISAAFQNGFIRIN